MFERARRYAASEPAITAALVLLGVYAVIRTLQLPEPVFLAWVAVAVGATLVWPVAGLTLLAALGPFTEAQTANGRVSAVPYLLAATGASLVLHVAITRALPRPSVPIVLAVGLLAGTAIGVAVSFTMYGTNRGIDAFQFWVPGLGGAMTVLLAAAWVAWRGEVRPLYVAVLAIVLGAALSVANALANDAVLDSPIGWLLRFDIDPRRLGGLLPVPNTAAALFLVGTVMSLTIALNTNRRWLIVTGFCGAAVTALALALTFSRSGYIALGLALVLLAWRRWPRFGLPILIGGALIAVPAIVLLWVARDVPLIVDQYRLGAWAAAARMWLENPVLGTGLRSFEWLHAEYGSPLLDAPHNEWLRLFAEGGTIVGLIGAAFAIATPIVLLRTNNLLAAGAGAAAAGLFVSAFFNNPFINAQLNVACFLIIGTGLGIASAINHQATD